MEKSLIFLILILIALGFAVYKTRKRRKITNVFLCLFVTLFFLLLIEFVYRNFLKEKRIYSIVNSYFQYDSLMGYKFKDTGKLKATEYFIGGDTIYNTYYTVLPDTMGSYYNYPFRKGYRSESSDRETVFLGCSVTMGECLADDQTLPYQYGKLTGISTVNRGCNGFGIHQVYQTFKFKYANQDNHKRVFVYTFLSDHLVRANGIYTWNMAGPYFTVSGDSLIFKGPLFLNKKVKGLSLAYYASFFGAFTFIRDNIQKIAVGKSIRELTDDDIAPGYLMLRKMAETINRTGGKFVILNWDSRYEANNVSKALDQNSVNRRIAGLVRPSGGLVLPVSPVIDFSDKKYFVPIDGHPAATTYRLLAKYLAENIR